MCHIVFESYLYYFLANRITNVFYLSALGGGQANQQMTAPTGGVVSGGPPGGQMMGTQMSHKHQMSGGQMQMASGQPVGGAGAQSQPQSGGQPQSNNQIPAPGSGVGGSGAGSGGAGPQMGGSVAGQQGPMGSQMAANGPMTGTSGAGQMADVQRPPGLFSSTQLQQLRAQIYAFKMFSRNQPLPDNLRQAFEGKRPFGGRPGMLWVKI